MSLRGAPPWHRAPGQVCSSRRHDFYIRNLILFLSDPIHHLKNQAVSKCDLEGYPQAVGVSQVSFEIEAEDYANSIIKNLSLIIANN